MANQYFNAVQRALSVAHSRYVEAEVPIYDKDFLLCTVCKELFGEGGKEVYSRADGYLTLAAGDFIKASELAYRGEARDGVVVHKIEWPKAVV